mgnify:CR=1 FL=1
MVKPEHHGEEKILLDALKEVQEKLIEYENFVNQLRDRKWSYIDHLRKIGHKF